MRIGIMELGRIGAFHTETLAGLEAVDSLVVTDPVAPHTVFMDRFADAFRAELIAFTEVVAGTRPSPCTVGDAVEASLIAEACTRSLREHRPVRLDEVCK